MSELIYVHKDAHSICANNFFDLFRNSWKFDNFPITLSLE